MIQWSKTVPRWAGTTVEPPESKKDEGYIVGDRPPAMWENWFRKGISESVVENRSVIEVLESGKADETWVQGELNALGTVKADKSWTQTELNKKADSSDVTDALNLKADKSWVTTELSKKATITALNSGLGLKADKTELTAGLELKADLTALTGHTGRTNNPHAVTKAQVGLDKVDNTSDASKPISLATATALGLKADLSYVNTELGKKANTTALNVHINKTDNPHGVTKAQIGLDKVDNTSDLAKPISTATQSALDGKVTANANITAGVYSKVAVDKKGLVTGGYDLQAGDIPNLDAGKITSGAFDSARIPNLSATKITSGTFSALRIPDLAMSKITGLQTALNNKTTESYVDTSIQNAIMSSWGGSY